MIIFENFFARSNFWKFYDSSLKIILRPFYLFTKIRISLSNHQYEKYFKPYDELNHNDMGEGMLQLKDNLHLDDKNGFLKINLTIYLSFKKNFWSYSFPAIQMLIS